MICRLQHVGHSPKAYYFGRLKGCASVLLLGSVHTLDATGDQEKLTEHNRPS